jgi:hypothetical protein
MHRNREGKKVLLKKAKLPFSCPLLYISQWGREQMAGLGTVHWFALSANNKRISLATQNVA